MKRPCPAGSPIDSKRLSSWTSDFSGYRFPVNDAKIVMWLDQFTERDRDLAARILDCIEFVTDQHIGKAYESVLAGLPGWGIHENVRQGQWRFVPFSTSPGESGDSMTYKFRVANKLNYREYNELFIYRSQLFSANLRSEDRVVFIDDFAGTGDHVCEAWKEYFQELLPYGPKVFLALVRAYERARKRIDKETGVIVRAYKELTDSDNFFSHKNKFFSDEEKTTILSYCQRADPHSPKGYGDSGFLLIFAHNCPNNTIPILHAWNPKWYGLFRRHE